MVKPHKALAFYLVSAVGYKSKAKQAKSRQSWSGRFYVPWGVDSKQKFTLLRKLAFLCHNMQNLNSVHAYSSLETLL